MPPFDGKEFASQVVAVVKESIDQATKPLIKRIGALETGLKSIPVPAEPEKIDYAAINGHIAELVKAIPAVLPGKDADPEVTARLVAAEVQKAVAALPKPDNGTSVTIDDVRPVLEDLVSKAVAALPKALDGVGVAGAVIDRDGSLVLTLTDGTTKELGRVVGKDADQAEIMRSIQEQVAKIPKPEDGKDGFGFDAMTAEYDGERTVTLRFSRGEEVKEFPITLPIVIDRGVWKEGKWQKGDGVTWGGSFFIAQCDTEAKPETNSDWRLSIKRGRDGGTAYDVARKAGFKGSEAEWLKSLKGEKGDPGPKGKDLTQITPDGQKF